MRKSARSFLLVVLTLVSAVVLGVSSTLTSAAVSVAANTALIMGGTGRPDPDNFPLYKENVQTYYINTQSVCAETGANCAPLSVTTPETAWPLYGGLSAPTWRDSILQGVGDLDAVVQGILPTLLTEDDHLVIFGYSQSGAIVAFEKRALAQQLTAEEQQQIQFVIIGNVSRNNGGLNGRANGFSIPIVNFPFGPTVPNTTDMATTDIAMKWDIIADAPLYITNPIAMLNALLGFEYVHGTYPDPADATPGSTPGGYSLADWQAIMDDPDAVALAHPDLVNVQQTGDTKYITITPRVLPLVAPLHQIGLGVVADLVEPFLRVLIEQTGYDRSIPYGQQTPFRIIPFFNPIQLAVDLIAAIPQGINQAITNLQNGGPPVNIITDGTVASGSSMSAVTSFADPTQQLNSKTSSRHEQAVVEEDNPGVGQDIGDTNDELSQQNANLATPPTQPDPPVVKPDTNDPQDENGSKPGDVDKPGDVNKPGDVDKPGDVNKPGDVDKPGDVNKPGDVDKPGDVNKPGDDNKPGDVNKPGDDNKPGDVNKPGDDNKPSENQKAAA